MVSETLRTERTPRRDFRSHAQGLFPCTRRWQVALFACVALHLAAATAEPAMPVYRWEAKKIYRYQFNRRIEVTPVEAGKPGDGRITDVHFILVIEVDTVDTAGTATADLRFMTPQITLPPFTQLDDEKNDDAPDMGQSRRSARAMEEVLAASKWRVLIATDGTIRMPLRQPDNWRAWMERLEQMGAWPKQLALRLGDLLETHFRIGNAEADDDWLPVLSERPVGAPAQGLRALRPRRRVSVDKNESDGRIRLRLQREPAEDPQPVAVPLIDAKIRPLALSRTDVKTLKGEAVFDPQVGLLDSASEHFSVKLTSRCGKLEQQARVWITYELRRLAPPLRGASDTEEKDTR